MFDTYHRKTTFGVCQTDSLGIYVFSLWIEIINLSFLEQKFYYFSQGCKFQIIFENASDRFHPALRLSLLRKV